jgi:hypothetical protein
LASFGYEDCNVRANAARVGRAALMIPFGFIAEAVCFREQRN